MHTSPVDYLKSINLTNWGSLSRVSGWAFVSGPKPIRVSKVLLDAAESNLSLTDFQTVSQDAAEKQGLDVCNCMLYLTFYVLTFKHFTT